MSKKVEPIATGTPSEVDVRTQRDYQEFCLWIGHALSQWSLLESELAFLYAVAMRVRELGVAVESFYASQSFQTNLKQVDVVVKIALREHPEQLAVWTNLYNRLTKLQQRRNQIAHGRVFGITMNSQDKALSEYYGVRLVPFYGRLRVNQPEPLPQIRIEKLKAYEPIDLAQLHEIIERIGKATTDIGIFTGTVTPIIWGEQKSESQSSANMKGQG